MSSPHQTTLFLLLAAACAAGSARAQHGHHDHAQESPSKQSRYSASRARYAVPDVSLQDHEGGRVSLAQELDTNEPVALNFIFTTCSTICPVMTATFAKMRQELGPDAERLHLISISIDPEYDTPDVLKGYAKRYGATGHWRFLTGRVEEIVSVLEAFDAYNGSKLNHRPLTFFRVPASGEWVRIEGLASGAELASEYRSLLEDP